MNKMKSHRVFPTLDMFIDIKAKNDEDAILIVNSDEEVWSIIDDCCARLSQLGYNAGNCDSTFVTDRFNDEILSQIDDILEEKV
tara:strand:- start:68 stop:319 length:252 start_codon:yes stop_codon:yes gene_type:complete